MKVNFFEIFQHKLHSKILQKKKNKKVKLPDIKRNCLVCKKKFNSVQFIKPDLKKSNFQQRDKSTKKMD